MGPTEEVTTTPAKVVKGPTKKKVHSGRELEKLRFDHPGPLMKTDAGQLLPRERSGTSVNISQEKRPAEILPTGAKAVSFMAMTKTAIKTVP